MSNQDSLTNEIEARAKEIHTDSYPMSIGELMSIYRDGELDIHPEFQRYFRWSVVQKSKFIESILLGIPIPSIFVSQREDGVWDVIDGVQRLSTIFEFAGMLKDEAGALRSASTLVGTDYLPALEGKVWEDEQRPDRAFPSSLRLDFKRRKLDLKIVKKESDPNAKYDLFERLNTLGSQLSDQEVRNCLLVMIDRTFYAWLEELSGIKAFQEAVALTERALQERYDMELVLRFLVLCRVPERELQGVKDVAAFITQGMRRLASDRTFQRDLERELFLKVFESLRKGLGPDCFSRRGRGRGRGGFLISVFEVSAIGLGHNLREQPQRAVHPRQLQAAFRQMWQSPDFRRFSRSGVSASSRLPRLVPLGRRLFDVP
jgi:hypothetical protein